MTTITELRDAFEAELHAIFSLDQTLAEERSAIKRKAFEEGRPLTAGEVERRKEIAATRGELAEAMEVLGLDTVDALEEASDVDKLLSSIGAVNQQLEDDLERLKKLEEKAKKAEAVAKGLAEVTSKLLSLKTALV